MKSNWKLKFLTKKDFLRFFIKSHSSIGNTNTTIIKPKIWNKTIKIPEVFKTFSNNFIKIYNGNKFIDIKLQKEMYNKSIGKFILSKWITSKIHFRKKKKHNNKFKKR